MCADGASVLSAAAARRALDGSPILLLDQDRSRWDPVHIVRGLSALDQAQARAYRSWAVRLCRPRSRHAMREPTRPRRLIGYSIAELYEQLARLPAPQSWR